MARCLVTSYGFVARHLVNALQRQGYVVSVVEKELSRVDVPEGVDVIKADLRYWEGPDQPFDYVFHLAGITNAVYAETNPMEAFEANVLATANLLAKCRPRKRLIFTSSAVVYGQSQSPLKESDPLVPISTYGVTKLAAEELVRLHVRTKGLSAVISRFFNLYGPGQSPLYIVPQLIIQAQEGCIRLKNRATERDFVYVGDAVDCLIMLASAPISGAVNIGSGSSLTVYELAKAVSSLFGGVRISVGHQHERFSADRLVADISVARRLGWEPKTHLLEGLKSTIGPAFSTKRFSPTI